MDDTINILIVGNYVMQLYPVIFPIFAYELYR